MRCILMDVVEFKQSTYKDYSLIEGFPSPDLTATITTKYLISSLKMKLIGYVNSENLFPVVRVVNGIYEHPIRLYESSEHKILAILSDQIIPQEIVKEYCKGLISFTKKKKIKTIYTVATIDSNSSSPQVYGITNNKLGQDMIKKANIKLVSEGMTSGIGAQLFILEKDLPVILLLGEMSTKTNYDVAAQIVNSFSKITNTKIDTKPLTKYSISMTKRIKQELKDQQEQKNEPKNIMYT